MTQPMKCKHCGGYGCHLCTPEAYKPRSPEQFDIVLYRLERLAKEAAVPSMPALLYQPRNAMVTVRQSDLLLLISAYKEARDL